MEDKRLLPMYEPGTPKYKSKYIECTTTTSLQELTEAECAPFFVSIPSLDHASKLQLVRLGLLSNDHSTTIQLLRKKHGVYLRRALYKKDVQKLAGSFVTLDSSRPWMIYWTLHALDLLDDIPDEDTLVGIVHTLEACWTNVNGVDDSLGGGFSGGVGQLPHCAPTYAAVNVLCIIASCDSEEHPQSSQLALDLLKRKRNALLTWYLSLRCERMGDNEKGSMACGFRMHHDGEIDVRATYCICSVASLLNILTQELMEGMLEHVVECQTYEGGFGGEPFAEAHGGYTFCALAALQILTKVQGMKHLEESGVNLVALRDWLVHRQMAYEGGFQGRSNKLVDGCYSFWVGGAIAVLGLNGSDLPFDSGVYEDCHDSCGVTRRKSDDNDEEEDGSGLLLFHQELLERYVLLCAQDVNGGLRDKPSKSRDFYHSCYNLSGLSVSQNVLSMKRKSSDEECDKNVLGASHPIYNIRVERVKFMIRHFH
jgi:Prenyltransferase, beta subunit